MAAMVTSCRVVCASIDIQEAAFKGYFFVTIWTFSVFHSLFLCEYRQRIGVLKLRGLCFVSHFFDVFIF